MDLRSPLNSKKKRIYDRYKKLKFWKIIDDAINDLVENQDIKETADHYYIVGYIVKSLVKKRLAKGG